MTFKQKLRLIYTMLGNIVWSIRSDEYAYKLMADTGIGYYLRTQKPTIYKTHALEYYGDDEVLKSFAEALVPDTKTLDQMDNSTACK